MLQSAQIQGGLSSLTTISGFPRLNSPLRPLLPTKVRSVPRVDDRRVISGIIHVIRNGLRWRDAPACYGPPKTLYNHFVLPFNWNLLGEGTHTVRALTDGVEFDSATFTVTTPGTGLLRGTER